MVDLKSLWALEQAKRIATGAKTSSNAKLTAK